MRHNRQVQKLEKESFVAAAFTTVRGELLLFEESRLQIAVTIAMPTRMYEFTFGSARTSTCGPRHSETAAPHSCNHVSGICASGWRPNKTIAAENPRSVPRSIEHRCDGRYRRGKEVNIPSRNGQGIIGYPFGDVDHDYVRAGGILRHELWLEGYGREVSN